MPAPHRPPPPGHRVLLVVGLVALLASACQVRVGTDVAVGRDGSGRLAVTVTLDEALATSLTEDGFDPFADLADLPDGWEAERRQVDGGASITVMADFDDPAGLADRVADLQEGLDEEDPLLLDDVVLEVADDGAASFRGRAGFRPPSGTGLDGGGITFDGPALADLLASEGDDVLRVDLRVTLPGPVVDTDADEVDGSTATWRLPPTELVEVRAVGDPPIDRTWWIVGGAVLVGLALGVLVAGILRRRSSARARRGFSPAG